MGRMIKERTAEIALLHARVAAVIAGSNGSNGHRAEAPSERRPSSPMTPR
jgi:hypothetical protein